MAKKKKSDTKIEAHTQLKTLESKWLKDHRLDRINPIISKVNAGKVAALLEFFQQQEMSVNLDDWPLMGAENLVKLEQPAFKMGLNKLLEVGVINSSYKFTKVVAGQDHNDDIPEHTESGEGGVAHFRCVKPGGVSIADRDEYVPEDQEVSYSEEAIDKSPDLQHAIANEWLMRIDQ